MTIKFTRENSRGVETPYELPAVMEVCDRCQGHGTHLHPDIGQHAYSPEEFAESFDDDEREEYFKRGGIYDVQCEVCHGRNVVAVVDEDEANRTLRGRRLLKLYFDKVERESRYRAEERHERLMGY